jgi:hypothetical protein
MKKTKIVMFTALGLLNLTQIQASTLNVDVISDQIVGRLWRGEVVSKEKLGGMVYELEKIPQKNKNSILEDSSPEEDAFFFKECEQAMKDISLERKEPEENQKNIEAFMKMVRELEKDLGLMKRVINIICGKFY